MTLDLAHFTPVASLLGGALIGAAASVLILGVGRILGAAGLYASLVLHPNESWRLAWLVGLVASPFLVRLIWALPAPVFPGTAATIAIAGLLVGFGTRLGSGCTSGHGVCGLGGAVATLPSGDPDLHGDGLPRRVFRPSRLCLRRPAWPAI